jgi:hypothetical protein
MGGGGRNTSLNDHQHLKDESATRRQFSAFSYVDLVSNECPKIRLLLTAGDNSRVEQYYVVIYSLHPHTCEY